MAATRRPAARTITTRGEQVTTIAMTSTELTEPTEDIDSLDLPEDRTQLMPLAGWNLYATDGEHIGRVFYRAGVMTAEWFDHIEEQDWILAKWGCRRLERAVIEILRLRDERLAEAKQAAQARRAAWTVQEEARCREEDAAFDQIIAARRNHALAA